MLNPRLHLIACNGATLATLKSRFSFVSPGWDVDGLVGGLSLRYKFGGLMANAMAVNGGVYEGAAFRADHGFGGSACELTHQGRGLARAGQQFRWFGNTGDRFELEVLKPAVYHLTAAMMVAFLLTRELQRQQDDD